MRAVEAVFHSWNAPRAIVYREEYGISADAGTAANVMQMVFGNRDAHSATGVCFSRDPATGRPGLYGEFLVQAQGEDIVAGTRTPEPIECMRQLMPEAYAELDAAVASLEHHYRDVQDIEFTVESGRLYVLQTRGAKRTVTAALRAAVDMTAEGLISRTAAVKRIDPAQLEQLLHPMIDPTVRLTVAAKGLSASPGAACGLAVFDADRAAERGGAGESVILVRPETTADDIHGLLQARGILTARGGMTSHAAVVARGLGKPCVAGCAALEIELDERVARVGEVTLREGDPLTIDGGTGRVIIGLAPLVEPAPDPNLDTVLEWADEARRLRVYANADTPEDAERARANGAEGIGLCRTEHMFMAAGRLPIVRDLILASTEEQRAAALARLLPMQQGDFEGIFEAMAGLPVTIRLLDPPLHEFLPPLEEAADEYMRERILALHEANPMLGTRGCRLGLEWPEIYEMQIRAIVRAARAVDQRTGVEPLVEIMHPLVAFASELEPARRADGAHRRGGGRTELPRRDDDRAAARSAPRGRPRRARRVLLIRHQRPNADDARLLARRRARQVPHLLPGARRARPRPVRDARHRRGRRAHPDRCQARPCRAALARDRHLRRARRRPSLDRVLRDGRARLRLVLTVPHSRRAPRGGAGRALGRRPLRGGGRLTLTVSSSSKHGGDH